MILLLFFCAHYTFNPYMSIICIHLHNSLCMYISICIFFFYFKIESICACARFGEQEKKTMKKKKKAIVTGVLVCGCNFLKRVRWLAGRKKIYMEKGVFLCKAH